MPAAGFLSAGRRSVPYPCPFLRGRSLEIAAGFEVYHREIVPYPCPFARSTFKNKKQEKKKEKRAQKGTPETGPKIVFLHKNCQEKS